MKTLGIWMRMDAYELERDTEQKDFASLLHITISRPNDLLKKKKVN